MSFGNSPAPSQLTKRGREELEGLFAKTGDIRNFVEDKLILTGIIEQHTSYSSDIPHVITVQMKEIKKKPFCFTAIIRRVPRHSPCSVIGPAPNTGAKSGDGAGVAQPSFWNNSIVLKVVIGYFRSMWCLEGILLIYLANQWAIKSFSAYAF